MRTQAHSLHLVYPPVSNQQAEWIKTDNEVEALLRTSRLRDSGPTGSEIPYYAVDQETWVLHSEVVLLGADLVDSVTIDLPEVLRNIVGDAKMELEIELGDKMFRIRAATLPPAPQPAHAVG